MSLPADTVHDPMCPEAHRPGAHLPVSRTRVDSWDSAIARIDACIGRAESYLAELSNDRGSAIPLVPLLSGLATAVIAALVLVVMATIGAPPIAGLAILVVVVLIAAAATSSGFGRMATAKAATPVVEQVRATLERHLALRSRLVAGRRALLAALDLQGASVLREG